MKKIFLLILVSVAVYGNNIKECLGGSVEACDYIADIMGTWGDSWTAEYRLKNMVELNCKDYMKVIRNGCNLGSGLCCALLGDEFHSISTWQSGSWVPKYGANCSLRNQNDAFKYYKKACELGESAGCQRYTELQDDIAEIDRRERDKTHKSDITVRQR